MTSNGIGIGIPFYEFSLILLFSAGLHLLMAVGRLLQRPATARSFYLSAIFVMVSWSLLHGFATLSGEIKRMPHILYTHIPSFFLLGPVSYRWLKALVGEEVTTRGFLFECIPGALATALLVPTFLLTGAEKTALAQSFIQKGDLPLEMKIIFSTGMLIYAFYLARSAFILWPYMTFSNLRREPSALLAAVVLAYAAILTTGLGLSLFVHRKWFAVVMYGLSLFAPTMFLLGARFPNFFLEFQQVVERGKYEVSRLSGQNMERIERELERLMREERLYEDGPLTLDELAERIALTPHALSEFLNLHRGTNFAGFVNGYRIDRVCELIEADPDRTVLSAAFEVGFTAKSTFNSAFLKHRGLTPSAFRRDAMRRRA